MPGEVLPRSGDAKAASRLSSFGFSGTIAHGLFVLVGVRSSTSVVTSMYRHKKLLTLAGSSGCLSLPLLALCDPHTILSSQTITVLSHHIVGGNILLPGVGYVEMAFAADADRRKVLSAVAVVRPCVLPAPGMGVAGERCTLRCTLRETGTFDIASLRSTGPLPHWIGYLADSCEASSSYT